MEQLVAEEIVVETAVEQLTGQQTVEAEGMAVVVVVVAAVAAAEVQFVVGSGSFGVEFQLFGVAVYSKWFAGGVWGRRKCQSLVN